MYAIENIERRANEALLMRFSQAWSERDLAGVMACFHRDAVYHASVGPLPGERAEGHQAISRLVTRMFAYDEGAVTRIRSTSFTGEAAWWRWSYHLPSGEVRYGCDYFDFRGGLIALKDAYRKTTDNQAPRRINP